MASPETYVNHAFGKMTSGVHSGYFVHEIVHLIWTNLNDIFDIYWCQTAFNTMFRSKFGKGKKEH